MRLARKSRRSAAKPAVPAPSHLQSTSYGLQGLHGRVHVPSGTWVHSLGPVETSVPPVPPPTVGPFPPDAGISEESLRVSRPATRKEKQWYTWNHRVIPALVDVYAQLLERTENLARLSHCKRDVVRCAGCPNGTSLTVVCLYFDSALRMLSASLLLLP